VYTSEVVSKVALKEELVALVAADLDTAERAQQAAREGATHEEAKPENDKDTRALEQSYVARGQAKRVDELRADFLLVQAMVVAPLSKDARVSLGALVEIEEKGATSRVFIAPARGGTALAGSTVQVVTPSSPLGRALLGKVAGDDCDVRVASRVRELSIVSVT
jgi:transcription elongation GreA/GreB family factor